MSMRHRWYWKALTVAYVVTLAFTGCSDASVGGGGVAQADGQTLTLTDTYTAPKQDTKTPVVEASCTTVEDCKEKFPNLRPCEEVECMANGDCAVFPRADCCADNDDCPIIDDECIESFCPEPGASCATRSICAICATHADCIEIAEPCEVGWCSEGGRCEFKELDICCADSSDCQLMDACIQSQCIQGRCAYGAVEEGECCDTQPVHLVGTDETMDFMESSDNPTIFWQVIETDLTPSPPYALYVGNSETMSTVTIGDVNAVAIFDLGQMIEGSQIDFRSHAYVNLAKTGTQIFQVILTGEGVPDQTLYSSTTTKKDDWHLIHANVTLEKTANYTLVLKYYQKGSIIGAELGVLVDNLEIRTDCSPYFECFDDKECDDGNPCTNDTCNVGIGTASCMHTPVDPIDGVDEVCGDGLDNDCNPNTFCVSVNAGDKELLIKPVAKGVNPATFYKAATSADAGYTASNKLSLLVTQNDAQGQAVHLLLDKEEDGDGGNLAVNLSGAAGIDILVYDDPPEEASDSWSYDPATGTGSINWVWGQCCVDGMVMAPLKPEQCMTVEIANSDGIDGIQIWQDASTSTSLNLQTFKLCGLL